MSVYKRRGAETYSYDFQLRGCRFSGDTGATNRREAESFEKQKRAAETKALGDIAEANGQDMTFAIAAARWWVEVGQHNNPNGHETAERNLRWLVKAIGAQKPLRDINDNVVAQVVAKRRGERVKGKKDAPLVSAATVNRTCTQPLREVLLRAKNVWKASVGEIDFGEHMLKEPQERVREASTAEESAILAELGEGYDAAVKFAFLSGCRRMEILGLEWPHVDFFSRRFTVTGKGGKIRTIPMSQAMYDLLWGEKNHHRTKVFTFVAKRTLKPSNMVKGKRYPLTESGLKSAMRRAVPAANVSDFRFHDTRHTAATRTLRKSNLRVVQKLLGHSDVQTTTKYAHALDEDIRDALEATTTKSPTKSPTAGVYTKRKTLRMKGKTD